MYVLPPAQVGRSQALFSRRQCSWTRTTSEELGIDAILWATGPDGPWKLRQAMLAMKFVSLSGVGGQPSDGLLSIAVGQTKISRSSLRYGRSDAIQLGAAPGAPKSMHWSLAWYGITPRYSTVY